MKMERVYIIQDRFVNHSESPNEFKKLERVLTALTSVHTALSVSLQPDRSYTKNLIFPTFTPLIQ